MDIPNVCVYIDDALVLETLEGEHLKTLESGFAKLQRSGLMLKMSKCVFMVSSLSTLELVISADGVRPKEQKRQVNCVRSGPTRSRSTPVVFGP